MATEFKPVPEEVLATMDAVSTATKSHESRCTLCHSGRVDLDEHGVCFGCNLGINEVIEDLAERTTPGAEELAEIAARQAVVRRLKDESFQRGEMGLVPSAALDRALPPHDRVATRRRRSREPRGRSGVRGVSVLADGRFLAEARLDGRRLYLGTFRTLEEAAAAARKSYAEIEGGVS